MVTQQDDIGAAVQLQLLQAVHHLTDEVIKGLEGVPELRRRRNRRGVRVQKGQTGQRGQLHWPHPPRPCRGRTDGQRCRAAWSGWCRRVACTQHNNNIIIKNNSHKNSTTPQLIINNKNSTTQQLIINNKNTTTQKQHNNKTALSSLQVQPEEDVSSSN